MSVNIIIETQRKVEVYLIEPGKLFQLHLSEITCDIQFTDCGINSIELSNHRRSNLKYRKLSPSCTRNRESILLISNLQSQCTCVF